MKFFMLGIFLTILLASSQQAEGLECYKCNSTKSSDDCGSNMKKTTCKSGTTECCDGVYSTTVSFTAKTTIHRI
ncbi:hypothetical protein AC249_AIPGENE20134 [Exaiptasia diaphana]|nr:hypothetical protein AC249_AIPGENE20134 [Exaiptasia diaphana]